MANDSNPEKFVLAYAACPAEWRVKPEDLAGRPSGIELAARFVEARLKAYVEENGSYDLSTGVMEYPGEGSQYVYELEEIIEGIRAIDILEGE